MTVAGSACWLEEDSHSVHDTSERASSKTSSPLNSGPSVGDATDSRPRGSEVGPSVGDATDTTLAREGGGGTGEAGDGGLSLLQQSAAVGTGDGEERGSFCKDRGVSAPREPASATFLSVSMYLNLQSTSPAI